jgi:hypothetical protein
MKMPDCRYFHHDAFRGREKMTCRLLERSGKANEWSLKLCQNCPVPGILKETECNDLLLEGDVARRFGLFPRVTVFALCADSMQPLDDPKLCPSCEAKRLGPQTADGGRRTTA